MGAIILTLAAAAACTSSPTKSEGAAASRSTAAPGTYGVDVDPSIPDPTDVATDAPASLGHTRHGTLLVSYSGWNNDTESVEIGSYLPAVVEGDGTCTLTLTRGDDKATASGPGTPDASSTSCSGLAVPGSDLSSGTWTAVVTYESSSSSASSEPLDLDVP
jgi:hypothetical protein